MQCIFCNPIYNLILYEDELIYILADPYPLIEGHLMIISKIHYGCVGEFERNVFSKLEALKANITNMLSTKYGATTIYEHGRPDPV